MDTKIILLVLVVVILLGFAATWGMLRGQHQMLLAIQTSLSLVQSQVANQPNQRSQIKEMRYQTAAMQAAARAQQDAAKLLQRQQLRDYRPGQPGIPRVRGY